MVQFYFNNNLNSLKWPLFLGTAFNIPKPSTRKEIYKKCLPLQDLSSTAWQYKDPITDLYVASPVPECVLICQNDLPFNDSVHKRIWRENFLGLGEEAVYTCSGFLLK